MSAFHPGGLTDREIQVLSLVAAGYSNVEIRRDLNLAGGTVDAYLQLIKAKVGERDRGALSDWYRWHVRPAYLWDYRL